ncbi:MAG: FkbM family methyltransferase, partial [Mangrovibacterium sp.]
IPFYRKWMFDGLASLNYDSAKNWLTHRLWMFDQQKLSVKKISCEVRKLDDFNFNPYFVKIDVQGHEFQVLQGSENTIRKCQPIFLIECVNEQIIRFLKKFNYSFYRYSRGEFSEGLGELNTFCMTKNKFYELTSPTKSQWKVHEAIPEKEGPIKEYELENG